MHLPLTNRTAGPDELRARAPLHVVPAEPAAKCLDEVVRSVARLPGPSEPDIVADFLEGSLERVQPRDDVDADRQVQGVGLRGDRLVEPAPGEIEHVARLQQPVLDDVRGLAQLGRVTLVSQRQLERRLVHAPTLLALDLEDEDVVRIVVDR